MVRGILADNDIEGHFQLLLTVLQGNAWAEVWEYLDITVENFEDLGLARNAPDKAIWQTCQSEKVVLVTANRRSREPHYLENTSRLLNISNCLPVFTLAKVGRIQRNRAHREKIVERLLDYLLEIDNYLGVGRLYLP